jgi:hypothetical protein
MWGLRQNVPARRSNVDVEKIGFDLAISVYLLRSLGVPGD